MMGEILHAVGVWAALGAVCMLPAWLVVRRCLADGDVADHAVMAAAAVMCGQAVLGTVWDRAGVAMPGGPWIVGLVGWSVASIVVLRRTRRPATRQAWGRGVGVLLGVLVVYALAVRAVDPVQHAALGQSDAYSHLGFLHDVLRHGALSHRSYPPGYAWVLAGPALAFGIDPYVLCRHGGAFFGVLLVLAAYVLVRDAGGRGAGLLAACCVAGAPPLYWLTKTSVGCFPNQLGLFLFAVLLIVTARWLRGVGGFAPIAAVVAGLLVTVPVFVLDAIWILVPAALLSAGCGAVSAARVVGVRWVVGGGLTAAAVACVVLAAWNPVLHVGGMLATITSSTLPDQVTLREAAALALGDYVAVKRWGFGMHAADAAAALLMLAAAGSLVSGLRRRCVYAVLFGMWGLAAGAAAVFGVLQFSSYQRAGWSLLLFVGCFGSGVVAWGITQVRLARHPPGRAAIAFGVLGMMIVGVWFYPRHAPAGSPAEDDLVRTLLALRDMQEARHEGIAMEARVRERLRPIHAIMRPDRQLVVVTRPFVGFADGQGEIAPSLLPESGLLRTSVWRPGANTFDGLFRRDRQVLVILDDGAAPLPPPSPVMQRINPGLADHFARTRAEQREWNAALARELRAVCPDGWTLHEAVLPGPLRVLLCVPGGAGTRAAWASATGMADGRWEGGVSATPRS